MSLSKTSKEALEREIEVGEDVDDRSSVVTGSSANNRASVTNGSTSETNQTGTTDEDFQSIKNALTQRESRQVFRLRVLVMMILLAAATSISVVIYNLERSSQIDEFESDYYAVAEKIIDALNKVTDSIAAISGIAVTATVNAQQKATLNASSSDTAGISGWPFVSIDAFQERARNARSQAGSIFVSLNPIVHADQLSGWEKYVQSDANSWM